MKRILSSLLLLAALGAVVTGCLKDKGFDNHTYGINDADSQPPGVGFVNSQKTDHRHTLGIDFIATDVTNTDALVINLEAGKPAASDVTITFEVDTMLVIAYNNLPTAPDVLKPLKPNQYTVPTTVTIPAGQTKALVPITIKTPNTLNPNITYGLGFRILTVSGGYTIAANLKTLVLAVSIKNAYDGYYQSKGAAFHPSYGDYVWNTVGVFACGNGFSLVTSGANSVDLSPGQPLYSGGITYFSAVLPRFTVDPTTKKVTITTTNTTVFDQFPAYDSRYDPATKSFFVKYGWSGTRVATDTFTYCGPR